MLTYLILSLGRLYDKLYAIVNAPLVHKLIFENILILKSLHFIGIRVLFYFTFSYELETGDSSLLAQCTLFWSKQLL